MTVYSEAFNIGVCERAIITVSESFGVILTSSQTAVVRLIIFAVPLPKGARARGT